MSISASITVRLLRDACLALPLALAALPARAAEGPLVIDHPLAARGDAAGALEALLGALQADPRDPQVPLLLNELAQTWSWVPGGRERVRQGLERALEQLGPHWNRDELLGRIVDLSLGLHDAERARTAQAARGFLREWLVLGGFGLRPAAALHDPWEPERAAAERALDPARRFATRRGEQGWTPLALRPLQVAVMPGSAAPDGAVSYALTHVQLPAQVEGYLVYTGPSARVWLNRSLVTTIDRDAERLDAELRVPVRLRAGWNRILVKLAGGRGARFTLRLTGPAGDAITPAAYAAAQEVDAVVQASAPPLPSWSMSRLALEGSARRQALLAWGLLAGGRGEEGQLLLEDLAALRPELREEAWFLVLTGDAAQRADHLPAPVRRDRAAQAYRAALERDPGHVRALRRLAEFALQDDRPTEAVKLLEQVLAARPDDLDTRLRLVDALAGKGWLEDAERELAAALGRGPDLPPVLAAQARLLARRERVAEAGQVEERLWRLDGTQTWTVARALDRAQQSGDAARIGAALQRLLGLELWGPEDLPRRRAEAARALGQREEELAAWRELCALRPGDPAPRLALAARLLEEPELSPAQRAEAGRLLDEVQAAVPGHHQARLLRQALVGAEERWWEEWAPDLERLVKEAPGRERWPRAATVCLFDQTVTRVWPDGAAEDVVHQVFRLLDVSGKERLGSRQKTGELLRVRTITAAGETLEPIGAGDTFEMPGLLPGAFVEHAWRSRRDAAPVQYTNGPFFFMDPDLTEPFLLSRWVIWVHRDAPVDLVERNLRRPGLTREVIERGEWRIHVYTARNMPRFEHEPFMPHREELLPWVKIVERRSLPELSELHRGFALEGRALSPTITRQAEALCHDLLDDQAKLERLWDFVQEHVTQPRGAGTAAQVLAARAGSKRVLLAALLRAADVQVEHAAAALDPEQVDWDSRQGPVDWRHPEPDNLVVWLLRVTPRGRAPVWLFPDAERLAPMAELPPWLSGASAYVCRPGGGIVEVLPRTQLGAGDSRTTTRLRLQPQGRALVDVESVEPGYGAWGLKERFQSAAPQALRQFFARQANSLFPGSRVLASGTPDLELRGAPLRFTLSLEAPQAVRARGDGALELGLPLPPANLGRTYGSHRQRAFDLVLKDGGGSRDLVELDLGPYVCPRLPDAVALIGDRLEYSLHFSRQGERVLIERVLLIRPGRVTPEAYPAFCELLQAVDEAERRTLILEEARQ